MEKYGSVSLLRSFAVQSAFRKGRIGTTLVRHALEQLKAVGSFPIYLLTNTAESFAARFGFVKINRNEIPSLVLTSSALGTTCPAGSTCMKMG